jgi:hypothetical protein
MAAYAATARLDGVRPRRLDRTPAYRPAPLDTRVMASDLERIDLVGRPVGEAITERWIRIRDAWGQTVFFLFDPDSWR